MSKIVLTTQIAFIILNVWILFFHRIRLGEGKNDRSFDRFYGKTRAIASFSILVLSQLFFYFDFHAPELIYSIFPSLRHLLDRTQIPFYFEIYFLAVFVFTAGIWLRRYAIKILGKFFTFEIGIRENHKIIDQGPYRIIRHPSYTGYLMMTIGIGLISYSWLYLIGLFLGNFIALSIRIHDEEKMLESNFGQPYQLYQSKTKRLIPYLY